MTASFSGKTYCLVTWLPDGTVLYQMELCSICWRQLPFFATDSLPVSTVGDFWLMNWPALSIVTRWTGWYSQLSPNQTMSAQIRPCLNFCHTSPPLIQRTSKAGGSRHCPDKNVASQSGIQAVSKNEVVFCGVLGPPMQTGIYHESKPFFRIYNAKSLVQLFLLWTCNAK